jgi:hypothetical protein
MSSESSSVHDSVHDSVHESVGDSVDDSVRAPDDSPTSPDVAPLTTVRVTYQGRPHLVREDQTLLEALLDGGEPIPNACRAGACANRGGRAGTSTAACAGQPARWLSSRSAKAPASPAGSPSARRCRPR